MIEEKDIVEYLNNEGFSTNVNGYGVIFIDVTKYGMSDSVMVDLDSKEIVTETPIAEEVNNKVIKPLMLMLGLNLIDYHSGKRYTPNLTKGIWNTCSAEKELLDLIYKETETDHERQD